MSDDNTSNLVGALVGGYVAIKVIDAIDKTPRKKIKKYKAPSIFSHSKSNRLF